MISLNYLKKPLQGACIYMQFCNDNWTADYSLKDCLLVRICLHQSFVVDVLPERLYPSAHFKIFPSGCSSVDRVLASEAKGRGFDPRQPHQQIPVFPKSSRGWGGLPELEKTADPILQYSFLLLIVVNFSAKKSLRTVEPSRQGCPKKHACPEHAAVFTCPCISHRPDPHRIPAGRSMAESVDAVKG
jgi:hypothetical protein